MGFITRLLFPRKARRLVHPVRAVKRKVTPKPVKKVLRAASVVRNPVGTAAYAVEKSAFSSGSVGQKRRKAAPALIYQHGTCSVRHRTPEAAERCKRS